MNNKSTSGRIRCANPPEKPTLIFDGDCGFCRSWVMRWKHITERRVDYRPSQDPRIREQFCEIDTAYFDKSVQFVDTDGTVYPAAEGVFRALATIPRYRWALWLYRNLPGLAFILEYIYAIVARNRGFFSRLTLLFWGRNMLSPRYIVTRRVFLHGIGALFLIAFVSFWVQITSLIGENGILPAREIFVVSAQNSWRAFFHYPTLCWFSGANWSLHLQCAAGVAASLLVLFLVLPAPALLICWALYLSLSVAGQEFMMFQWDSLLLETGLLAVLFAPWKLRLRGHNEPPPSTAAIWLLRWLLFRLMFESGAVKLLSGDETWNTMTALYYHYETQPLPTPLAWFLHHSPHFMQRFSVWCMFVIELVFPIVIFMPRRARFFAAAAFTLLQVVILLSGNYCFFNLLTILLVVPLIEDSYWPRRLTKWMTGSEWVLPAPIERDSEAGDAPPRRRTATRVRLAFALIIFLITLNQLIAMLTENRRNPGAVRMFIARWTEPFRSFNTYGLFATMTTTRPEIIIEGSSDGENWKAYEFRYKPGDLTRRPPIVAPHQPRVDWQLWFEALTAERGRPASRWFASLCMNLMFGNPIVTRILAENPFPDQPPRFLRAQLYQYHFTTPTQKRETGNWWTREFDREFLPPVSLRR